MDIDRVRERYQNDRPAYARLAATAAEIVRNEAASRALTVRVEHRAKEMNSLLKKVLFGTTKYKSMIDRAGVRIVLETIGDLGAIHQLVTDLFCVKKRIDVGTKLSANQFGYGGVHYHLELVEPAEGLDGLRFELQVHTRAQSLWASLSHKLAYKSRAEEPQLRSINRLAALLELVDLEIVRIRSEISGSPDHDILKVVELLESSYIGVATVKHDPVLTLELVPELLALMGTADVSEWSRDFESFMQSELEQLREIYERYKHDSRYVLLSQPESLLIFYARDRDPFSFDELWPERLGDGLKAAFVGLWPNP